MNDPKKLVWIAPLAGALVALLIFALLPMLKSRAKHRPDYWPSDGWLTNTPEEQGWDSAKLAEGLLAMREKKIDIHSLLLIRNERVFLDAHFYPYDGASPHELASVTKSVMTTLIGIAVDQGILNLDDPILKFFPERKIDNLDASKEQITVRHLTSMSSGLECTSEGDELTLKEMKQSPDWTQFALDRKVAWEPGSHFVYCSPAIHLLSPILQQATGMTALEFGKKFLFEPLGIHDVLWSEDPQGASRGSEGIYLHYPDAAKMGLLWLQDGYWDGQQIVSSGWVKQAVSIQMDLPGEDEDDYGYGWWVSPGSPSSYSMIGRGGQRVLVVPQWNLIVTMTGGGTDFDEIEPYLVAAIGNMNEPLPPNPEGVAQLQLAVSQVAQPPSPEPISPMPATAMEISNKTYAFEPNPSGIETLCLVFDDTAQAVLNIKKFGKPAEVWPVGLDGVLRMSSGDYSLPQGARGKWLDQNTFLLEYDNIGNNDHVFITARFDADSVSMQIRETAHEGALDIVGSEVSQ